MPALDFTEIAIPTAGHKRDTFELFARDFLQFIGFNIVRGPDRGADGGKDLIVDERRTGVGGETKVRWLVSCKHKAHSGTSVSPNDEPDIQDRLNTHQCTAFLGFYSTLPSSGLSGKFSGAAGKFEYQVFDPERIEHALLSSTEGIRLAKRYFPKSVASWQASNKQPAKIFAEPTELKCDNCGANLLRPEPHGIVAFWHPYHENDEDSDNLCERTDYIYFACKGNCDDYLRRSLRARKMVDGWNDIEDLAIPTVYLRMVMGTVNELNAGKKYSPQAFEKTKDLLINLFPLICRHLSDDEIEQIHNLQKIPGFLGGLGG